MISWWLSFDLANNWNYYKTSIIFKPRQSLVKSYSQGLWCSTQVHLSPSNSSPLKTTPNTNYSHITNWHLGGLTHQLVMIIVCKIFHLKVYWSIFQSLIWKLRKKFDACQMIIFWSLLFGGQRLFWGQKLVISKNDYKLIERLLDDLNYIINKFSPEINHCLQKSYFLPC